MINSNNNETRYIYDNDGNLVTIIDAIGNKTNYQYDGLNRWHSNRLYLCS